MHRKFYNLLNSNLNYDKVRETRSGSGSRGWDQLMSTWSGNSVPSARTEHVMASAPDGNGLAAYIHGGYHISYDYGTKANLKTFSDVWKIDRSPTGNWRWTRLKPTNSDSVPEGRFTHSATVVPESETATGDGEYLFIFGGRTTKGESSSWKMLGDTWKFDVNRRKWEELKIRGPSYQRMYHTMVFFQKCFVVFGGYKLVKSGYGQYPYGYVYKDLIALNVFDKRKNYWKKYSGSSMEDLAINVRMSHTAVIEDDMMYVFGGR